MGRGEVYGLEGSRVGTAAGAGELQRGIVCGVGDGDGHALNNPLARPPGDEGHALVEPVADAVAGGREVLPAQFPV